MSAMEMRSFVVQYLRPLARFFQDRIQGQFAGRYDSYCSNLAKSGSWGDELSLLGAAHLLRRPIHLVTDTVSDKPEEYIRIIEPPSIIHESLWGSQVVLACFMDRHFDATEPDSS